MTQVHQTNSNRAKEGCGEWCLASEVSETGDITQTSPSDIRESLGWEDGSPSPQGKDEVIKAAYLFMAVQHLKYNAVAWNIVLISYLATLSGWSPT